MYVTLSQLWSCIVLSLQVCHRQLSHRDLLGRNDPLPTGGQQQKGQQQQQEQQQGWLHKLKQGSKGTLLELCRLGGLGEEYDDVQSSDLLHV